MNNQSTIVQKALEDILCEPSYDENKISLYFSKDYQQDIDGKTLNYNQFIEHVLFLKQHTNTNTISLSFLSIVANNDTVFSHHHVKVKKHDGTINEFEVLARFTVISNKIVRCQELTRLINGNRDDADLGSQQ